MIYIAFGLGCLYFIKRFLGGGFRETVEVLISELVRLRKAFSERGAANMVGGIVLAAIVVVLMVNDNIGKLAKLGMTVDPGDAGQRLYLALGCVFFIAVYFLICASYVIASGKSNTD